MSKKQLNCQISKEIYDELHRRAQANGVTIVWQVNQALSRYLDFTPEGEAENVHQVQWKKDWDDVPKAKWRAIDADGYQYYYNEKPRPGESEWIYGENRADDSVCYLVSVGDLCPHWRDTLEARPS